MHVDASTRFSADLLRETAERLDGLREVDREQHKLALVWGEEALALSLSTFAEVLQLAADGEFDFGSEG